MSFPVCLLSLWNITNCFTMLWNLTTQYLTINAVIVRTLQDDTQDSANWDSVFIICLCRCLWFSILWKSPLFCPVPILIPASVISQHVCGVRVCVCVLTDVSRALGDVQVGASTPRSPLEILLTAATVRPSGVVFALAAQLVFVIHTAVGVKVALAPVKEGEGWGGVESKKDNHINMSEFSGAVWKTGSSYFVGQCGWRAACPWHWNTVRTAKNSCFFNFKRS